MLLKRPRLRLSQKLSGWFRIFIDWATGRSDFIMACMRGSLMFFLRNVLLPQFLVRIWIYRPFIHAFIFPAFGTCLRFSWVSVVQSPKRTMGFNANGGFTFIIQIARNLLRSWQNGTLVLKFFVLTHMLKQKLLAIERWVAGAPFSGKIQRGSLASHVAMWL